VGRYGKMGKGKAKMERGERGFVAHPKQKSGCTNGTT